MNVYIKLSDALKEAAPAVVEDTHHIFTKQFDNVWVKQGFQVFEAVFEHLEDDQIAENVEFYDDSGEELTPDEVVDILDQNNVIQQ